MNEHTNDNLAPIPSEKVRNLIEAFLAFWPNAEYGPGHIALSDYNLADSNIDFCWRLAQTALGEPTDAETAQLAKQMNYLAEHSETEIEATMRFLELLLLIDETEREGADLDARE